MNQTRILATKWVLVLLVVMPGLGCLGSERNPLNIQIWQIWNAVVMYRSQEGKFPATLNELADDASLGLEKEALLDRWGEPFGFEYSGDEFVLISSGPDTKMGTKDDMVWGSNSSYVESWKVRHGLPVDRQGTNAVQKATPDPVPPPVKDGGTAAPGRIERPGGTSGHASPDGWQNSHGPVENKRAPWQLLSLIGIAAVGGVVMAWRHFGKRRKRE